MAENIYLNAEIAAVGAEHGLVLITIKIFGFQIQPKRLHSSGPKIVLLPKQSGWIARCLIIIGKYFLGVTANFQKSTRV